MREILSLIPREYRKGGIVVALLVPVRAVLDLIGVAALLPVMMLLLDPQKLHSSFLQRMFENLGFSSDNSFALFVIMAVVCVIFFKIIISLLINRYQNRYLLSLYRNLSSRLFVSLYSRGLLYIKNQNSARMSFNVIAVCNIFVNSYIGGWMSLVGQTVFVLFLLAALLVYSPMATIIALAAFIPAIAAYLFFVRKPLREMSMKGNEIRRNQNRLLYEAFRGYSEVQVNEAFPQINERFNSGLKTISNYQVRSNIISSIPSYAIELSAVLVVGVMLLYGFLSGAAPDVVFIGIFTVALLKLMPAVRTIVSSVTSLNATSYTKEIISDIRTPGDYTLQTEPSSERMEFERAIEIKDLTFSFPDDEEPVFRDFSLKIVKGERFGIKGRTGSGKTTLFNILLGLYFPDEGCVEIDGRPLTRDNVSSWHKIVGYVPQDVFVADSTILENVALGQSLESIDRDKVAWALEIASMKDFVDSLKDGVDTKIGEAGCRLSGGQRQRLGIARALYKDSSVFFFDEATSSLDAQTEKEVNDAISTLSASRSDITIIVISHRDSTMSYCDRIIEI